jgi:hypothetical protein
MATLGLAALGLLAGLATGAFFMADFAAAGLAFFAGEVRIFAGFFIAFAMESTITTKFVALVAQFSLRVKPIYALFNGLNPPAQCFF